MPTIGTKGSQLDLLIRQGATFGPMTVTMQSEDSSAIDLSGCTIRSQIRKTPTSPLTDGISAIVNLTDPLAGRFTWEFSDEDTATLDAGVDENSPESLYVWDMEILFPNGNVKPLFYGDVKVFREVTKETP